MTCVVGKNGCGKSTLLSILAGVLRPDGGQVLFDGKSPFSHRDTFLRIGFVPQGDSLLEDLTVADNLAFWAAAGGGNGNSCQLCVDLLGIAPFRRKRVRDLSGGMRRRVALATALQSDPDYLILDEPYNGLDLVYREELSAHLQSLSSLGKTILYTTHSVEELPPEGGRVFLFQSESALTEYPPALWAGAADRRQNLLHSIKGEVV